MTMEVALVKDHEKAFKAMPRSMLSALQRGDAFIASRIKNEGTSP
jgi:hypothetical protein